MNYSAGTMDVGIKINFTDKDREYLRKLELENEEYLKNIKKDNNLQKFEGYFYVQI